MFGLSPQCFQAQPSGPVSFFLSRQDKYSETKRLIDLCKIYISRRAGECSEAEQSASTNMAFVTVWFLEKPGTELTPVENCLRAVLELVRRRQNSNVLKVHSFPVILILNMPWFLRCSLSKRQ